MALFKELLAGLGIPYHVAPAEAEAECTRLATLNLVDAVWSEDSDVLMFGASNLLRNDVDNKGQKCKTHVRVYDIAKVHANAGMDRDGLITFAMLAGCDYTKGLLSCGPARAFKAAKQDFRHILRCARTHEVLARWREKARQYFQEEPDCRNVIISDRFPDKNVVDLCINPVVSSRDAIEDLSGRWEACWRDHVCEPQLRNLLAARFNCWDGEWLKKIEPILWARSVVSSSTTARSCTISYESEPLVYDKKLLNYTPKNTSYDIKPLKAKNGDATDATTRIQLEPRESVTTVRGTDFGNVKFLTLTSIAQIAFPDLANSTRIEKPPASTSKRKRQDADQSPAQDGSTPAKRRGRPPGVRNRSKPVSIRDESFPDRGASLLQTPKIVTPVQAQTCNKSSTSFPRGLLADEEANFDRPEDDLPEVEDMFGQPKSAPPKSTPLGRVSGNLQRNGPPEKSTATSVNTPFSLPSDRTVEPETIDLTSD